MRLEMEDTVMMADGRSAPHRGSAFHSVKGPVHHNHPRCTKGALIGRNNRRPGDGGKPLCVECQALNEIGT